MRIKLIGRNLLLLLISLGLGLLLAGCSSTGNENGNTATSNSNSNSAPANTGGTKPAATTTPATTASTGDKVGVAECDEYLEKYEACLKDKVPEQARAMLRSSFEQNRKAWQSSAATPEGRAGLAQACKAAREAAKQSMAAYNCNW